MPHPATMRTPRGGTVVMLVNQYPENGEILSCAVQNSVRRITQIAETTPIVANWSIWLTLVELWNEVVQVSNFLRISLGSGEMDSKDSRQI